ncbi:glycosyltransferase N-terminal domain-containing protein [Pelagibacteraceae bacterium]|nr:glycosyltransferase N-terminal domain-containing protein [Pelagibacteraceae bacterium]
MILLYRVLTTLIYPILIIFIYLRKILKKEDPLRFREKILVSHFNVKRRIDSKLIWFHAASIGELKSIIPIIEELNKNKYKLEFLITTTTLSSGNLAKIELKKYNNVHHRFIPLDVEFLINKFLFLWKPNIIFLVDSEIWPNLILQANKYKIPLALINARLTTKSYNKWIKFPQSAKKIFSLFNLCLVSNLQTKKYLEELSAKNIYFNGNIKLIGEIDENKITNVNEKILLKKKFWIAASTHKGEDILCLKTHLKLKEKYNDIITIIAPRHIERSQQIKSLSEKFNLNTQILDKDGIILENKEIIIINSFGVLQNYYKYAKSVFIGKSTIKKLENASGQNPIDAAKLRCKIYHGPYVYNFKEIYKILEKNNISKEIRTYEELSINLINDLESLAKENDEVLNSINNLGQKTLTDTMKYINNFLFNEIK